MFVDQSMISVINCLVSGRIDILQVLVVLPVFEASESLAQFERMM